MPDLFAQRAQELQNAPPPPSPTPSGGTDPFAQRAQELQTNPGSSPAAAPSLWERVGNAAKSIWDFDKAEVRGAAKSVRSLADTGARGIDWVNEKWDKAENADYGDQGASTPKLAPKLTSAIHTYAPSIEGEPKGWGEHIGSAMEQAAEYALGEGEMRKAFEALPMMEKVKQLQPVMKVMEKFPNIGKYLSIGARQAALSGGQAAAHGADAGETGESALFGGVVGAGTEGAMDAFRRARVTHAVLDKARELFRNAPKVEGERLADMQALRDAAEQSERDMLSEMRSTRQSADEEMQRRLDEQRGIRQSKNDARETALSEVQDALQNRAETKESRIAKMEQQRAAAAAEEENRIARMRAGRQSAAQAAIKDTIQDAHIGAMGRADELLGESRDPSRVITFGQAGEELKDRVRSIFKGSDAEKNFADEMEQIEKLRDRAIRSGDVPKIEGYTDDVDQLLNSKPPEISEEKLQAARSIWRDAKGFDKLHRIVEGAHSGISEEYSGAGGAAERILKGGNAEGGALQTRMRQLLTKQPQEMQEIERLIGKEGVNNLYRSSNLVSSPEYKNATATILERVSQQLPTLSDSEIGQQVMREFPVKSRSDISDQLAKQFPTKTEAEIRREVRAQFPTKSEAEIRRMVKEKYPNIKSDAEIRRDVSQEFPNPDAKNQVDPNDLKGALMQAMKKHALGVGLAEAIGYKMQVPAAISAPFGIALTHGANFVWNRAMTSPAIGRLLEMAVHAKMPPGVAAALIVSALRRQMHEYPHEEHK